MVWVARNAIGVKCENLMCLHEMGEGFDIMPTYCINFEVRNVRPKDIGDNMGVPLKCNIILESSAKL